MTPQDEDKILSAIRFSVAHVRNPLCEKSEDWQQTADQWLAQFWHKDGFFTVDYYTGAGHRTKKKVWSRGGVIYQTSPKTPTKKDILFALWCDSQACHENFHNWCGIYGYSKDSIKALNTYKSCLENGSKLARLGIHREALDELFIDY